MTMPSRPREHVLESESREILGATLPSEWTISDVVNDYGLDSRVEIFEAGRATGLAFWVQLKGTDEPDLRRALRRSFDVSALNYMSAQADPVLLVRYLGTSKALYGSWLHAKDIVLKKAGQRSYTWTWSDSNRLLPESAVALAEEVRRFRRFSGPIQGTLRVEVDLPSGLSSARAAILMLLSSKSASAGGLLTFPPAGPYDVTVRVTKNMLRVDMSVASIRAETVPGSGPAEVADNVLVAAAVCLARLGRADAACALVVACNGAPLLSNEDVAERLAPAFGVAGRWREASDLALAYDSGGGPEVFTRLLNLDPLMSADQMGDDAARHVADNLVRQAEAREQRGDDQAGTAWYNAGNFLFQRVHDYPSALRAYEGAARARADYLDQGYYLAETAAALFENGRYRDAASMYERAWEADHSPDLVAKRADCLAHAGEHAEALRLFREHENTGSRTTGTWLLKRIALEAITTALSASDQDRDPEAAAQADHPEGPLLHPGLRAQDWERRIKPPVAEEDIEESLGFLTAVCAFPAGDVDEPWALLLHMAHVLDRDDLFVTAVEAGWHRHGEDLVTLVLATLAADDDEFSARFTSALEAARQKRPRQLTLRQIGDDGARSVSLIPLDLPPEE